MFFRRNSHAVGAMALVATVIVTGFAFAQDAPATDPNAAPQTFRAKQILGSKVAIQGNTSVGTVDDIVLDEHGNVDYLIVATSAGQLVTVPWDAAVYNSEKRLANVQITPEQFQQIPTYTVQQYPVYSAPTYRTQTYKYYGLTPGQSRRMIRRGAVVIQ